MGMVNLASGGFDSSLISLMAVEEGVQLFPLFIDYGQLGALKEYETVARIHKEFCLPEVCKMNLSGFGEVIASGITNQRLRINEDAFLPGRNLLLLLSGAAYAYKVGANSVAIGLLDPITRLFPDQSKEFTEEAEAVIKTAIGKRISILTPLIEFTKKEVMIMARKRGLKNTYSCHAGTEEPCGFCVACTEIINAGMEE